MYIMKTKQIIGLAILLSVIGLGHASVTLALNADDEIQPPELPPACASLQVDAGNEVAFHVYAIGVQIYRWNGTAWDFVAPEANLFADAGYHGKVGTHYAGPTWESNSGSKVIGRRIAGCPGGPNAIDWLKLEKVTTDGAGIFADITFIQRVNTAGGVKPTTPGTTVGEQAKIPYTTEYYFYRAED